MFNSPGSIACREVGQVAWCLVITFYDHFLQTRLACTMTTGNADGLMHQLHTGTKWDKMRRESRQKRQDDDEKEEGE